MSDLVGKTIAGKYRVDASLGKGGMAEVFKVWDFNRSAYLSMKILHADLAEDKVFLRRFRREALTLRELQHPNIVRFYGLETDADLTFMLMDYVEGTTLRREIFKSESPLSVERVASVLRPVCYALNYAHKSGFVHCDVKPANIMIHKNGTILVADFGIARMTEASTMTMVGVGTPAYMAPEQIRGENPGAATDIYALGVVLFELLTGGERPFTGEHARTTGTTGEKIRWEQLNLLPPSPRKFNRTISPELSTVVLQCLEKDPEKRFRNALDLLDAFERNMLANATDDTSSEDETEIDPVPIIKTVTEEAPAGSKPNQPGLPSKDSLPKKPPFWLGFRSGMKSRLLQIRSVVSSRQTLSRKQLESFGPGLWWIAGAILVSAIIFSSIMLWSLSRVNQDETGGVNTLPSVRATVRVTHTSGTAESSWPVPDGHGNLYFTSNRDGKQEIYVLTSDKKIQRVTHTSGTAESWSPTPDGHGNLYFTTNRDGNQEIYALTTDKKITRVTRTPGNAESWSPVPDGHGNLYFTTSRDGKQEIYVLTSDKKIQRVTHTPSNADSSSPAPDGHGNLYFTSNRDGKQEIYVLTTDRKIERVTHTPKNAESWGPVPDGHGNLYFTTDRDGNQEIYVLTSEKRIERVTNTPDNAGSWAPIPDGQGNLYFTSDRDGKPEIYVLTTVRKTLAENNFSQKKESSLGEQTFIGLIHLRQQVTDFLCRWLNSKYA